MDDHIIIIGDANGLDGWKWTMTIDLKELAEATGRKDKKFKCVEIPLTRAKKLLQLIRRHCYRNEDLEKVDFWMAKNPKLAMYWGRSNDRQTLHSNLRPDTARTGVSNL